jgi:hypothetical protein
MRKSSFDNDEDYAFALSLHQEEQDAIFKPSSSLLSEDEAYAFSIQKEEEGAQKTRQKQQQQQQHSKPSSSSSSSKININCCNSCNKLLNGHYITALDKKYHSGCFKCIGCLRPIKGRFTNNNNEPYHIDCAEELFSLKCSLCNSSLVGQYNKHSFFNENYCQRHVNARSCFSCSRREPTKESNKEGFAEYSDGRLSCMDCVRTAILDSSEAKPLYLQAVDFMEHVLHLTIPCGMREVPILAVDLPSLNEQKIKDINKQSHVRGLTLSTVGEIRHHDPSEVKFNINNGKVHISPPVVYSVEQYREVTAVLVLFGLPASLTASILAHEALHVWIKLTKGFQPHLPPQIEEGLCQVISIYLICLTISNSSISNYVMN